MLEFRVRIEIDVDADNELAAAEEAWSLLSSHDAYRPVVDVFRQDHRGSICGRATRIDLHSKQPVDDQGKGGASRASDDFVEHRRSCLTDYPRRRDVVKAPIFWPDGSKVELLHDVRSGLHRLLIDELAARFAQGSVLLHLAGDSDDRRFLDKGLGQLRIPELNHDKLPDVVLYDKKRKWLFLIEAVTSHGPVSPKRHAELESMLGDCPASRVYVTAFMDFAAIRKYASEIVWESEVWIAEFPDHMIHFNGDKFLGPYPRRAKSGDT